MKSVEVKLPHHRYQIDIELGATNNISDLLSSQTSSKQFFVISNNQVAKLYGEQIIESLRQKNLEAFLVTADISEENKSLKTCQNLWQQLIDQKIDRYSTILALGGGVVTDVAGFVAATILRGVSFIPFPTSLLAQVDAAIGGKVGVNFHGAKNLLGCFHQPSYVLIDPSFLNTLPKSEFLNGMAEVIKYALIGDPELFTKLENYSGNIWQMEEASLEELIYSCVKQKATIVSQDEREKGIRTHLNFGHTLGHALELEYNLGHGEAITKGMAFAALLSQNKGLCKEKKVNRVINLLKKISQKRQCDKLNFESIYSRMILDKKRVGNSLNMVLMKDIGNVAVQSVAKDEIYDLFQKPEIWWG